MINSGSNFTLMHFIRLVGSEKSILKTEMEILDFSSIKRDL